MAWSSKKKATKKEVSPATENTAPEVATQQLEPVETTEVVELTPSDVTLHEEPLQSSATTSVMSQDAPLDTTPEAMSSDQGETASKSDQPKERFRSWTTDSKRGFYYTTDEINRKIVLQFAEKPADEILQTVKEAGFRFTTNYYGLPNTWIRFNDYAGRFAVEKIQQLVRKQDGGHDGVEF